MITRKGYAIEQHPYENRIVITIPQTFTTMTNTLETPVKRRVRLTDSELGVLLNIAIAFYEGEEDVTWNVLLAKDYGK